ncbi:MAG: hemolysin family protein [Lachnospiraceae bacterium]|nr:hemolysin family protein [Lachnospiraceae bacterium]
MDSGDAIRLIILFMLLILSALFSSAETCLTTITKIRVMAMVDEKRKNANTLLKLKEMQTQMLTAILIGNNIVNLTASSLTTTFVIDLLKKHGITGKQGLYSGIGTGILTLLVLIFGEITPKSLATIHSEKLSLMYARPVYAITILFKPISFFLNKFSGALLKLFKISDKGVPQITENEFLTILDVSHEEGVIEKEEHQMINNVVDFGDSLAKDVLVPKIDVGFVDADYNYEQLMDCYKQDKYTRMPVFSESEDNIIGIINLKDLFFYNGEIETFNVRNVMREAYFTYEYKKISELFMEMKRKSIAMAIVLDEYGAVAGILTMEDLVEEIVGEIRDEYDTNEEDEITKLNDTDYILLGVAKLDDIDDRLGIKIESENYDSIAGHIINLLDHFPNSGEHVKDMYAEYTVLEASNNHIDKVKIHLLQKIKDDEEEK